MKHLIIPDNLNDYIREAMKTFWDTRAVQSDKQQESGGHDQGNRSAVTGGKQLDGFVNFICEILKVNGIPQNCIYADKNLELPGYYRPNKKWDLLVVKDNILVIAIEFKSQIGPSFGNNFNNRTEEAMGSALDVWTHIEKACSANKILRGLAILCCWKIVLALTNPLRCVLRISASYRNLKRLRM